MLLLLLNEEVLFALLLLQLLLLLVLLLILLLLFGVVLGVEAGRFDDGDRVELRGAPVKLQEFLFYKKPSSIKGQGREYLRFKEIF